MLCKMSKYFGNFLVHLLEPLSFRLRCISFLLSKLCFIIKVSTIYGVGRDTKNPCHNFNSQGLALRILGFRVICPKFQGPISRVLCVRVPCPRFPESQGHGSQGPGSQGLGSQVLILDYANYKNTWTFLNIFRLVPQLWCHEFRKYSFNHILKVREALLKKSTCSFKSI